MKLKGYTVSCKLHVHVDHSRDGVINDTIWDERERAPPVVLNVPLVCKYMYMYMYIQYTCMSSLFCYIWQDVNIP